MRKNGITLAALIFTAVPAMAVVGGGDIFEDGRFRYSHIEHVVAAKSKCTECHPKLYTSLKQHKNVTMEEMEYQGKSCGACHNGKKAFSIKGECARCHKST